MVNVLRYVSMVERLEGKLERLSDGFDLLGESLAVLGENPWLLAYPLAGGLVSLVIFATVLTTLYAVWPISWLVVPAVLLGTYVAIAYVLVLFVAALVHETCDYHRGVETSLRTGLSAAADNWRTLFLWSLVTSTIGVVLGNLADKQGGVGGRVVGEAVELGWSAATFLIVPAILFDDATWRSMFQTSAGHLGDSWETVVGALLGLRLVSWALAAVGSVITGAMVAAGFWLPLYALVGGTFFLGAALSNATLQGVTKATVYHRVTASERDDERELVENSPEEVVRVHS